MGKRNRMWRLLSGLILATGLVAVLAACGSDPTATPTATPTPVPPTATPTAAPATGATAEPSAPATATPVPAPSFDAEAYFSGKTLRIVVAWDPGNSIDAHARAVSRVLPRYIPGNPKSIVVNKDGAAGTAGGNWWHENAQGDGLWLLANTGANPISQILRPGVRYDFRDYTSIGGIMQRTTMWMASGDAPYSRIQEASGGTEEFTVGLNTESETGTAKALALAQWLNLPMRPLYGIGSGFAAYLTTFDRGDADSYISGSAWYRTPGSRPGWFTDGVVEPFAMLGSPDVFANNGEIDVPNDLPPITELLTDQQKLIWSGMNLEDTAFYRGLFTPKTVEPEVLAVLRKAFDDMFNDPEYQEIYESLVGLPVDQGGRLPPEVVNEALDNWAANADAIKAVYAQFLPQ